MGKSRRSNGSGRSAINYTEPNDEVYSNYESRKEKYTDKENEIINQIYDFCNAHNLELIDTFNNGDKNNYWDDELAVIAFRDPKSGIIYNIYGNAINDEGFVFEPEEIIKNMEDSLEIMNNFPPKFNHGVNVVNFVHEAGVYGYVRNGKPNSIQISPLTFSNGIMGPETGVKGVFAHELTHAWEIKNHGHIGALTKFSELNSYPTEYARDTENMWSVGSYSDNLDDFDFGFTHGECISTVVEQVYSHKLRNDALMKNGDSVETAFYNKYGYTPDTKNSNDSEKMFNMYCDEWSELVSEANIICPSQ